MQRGAVFDPDVVYDEAEDRFVIGIDGNGDSYCVAASQTGDPTGAWYRYGFPTDVNGAFFDFPHMGVGGEAGLPRRWLVAWASAPARSSRPRPSPARAAPPEKPEARY